MEKLPGWCPPHLLESLGDKITAEKVERPHGSKTYIHSAPDKVVLVPGQMYFVPGWKYAPPLVANITGYFNAEGVEKWNVEHRFWAPLTFFLGTVGYGADLIFLVDDKTGLWYGNSIPFMVPINSHEEYNQAIQQYSNYFPQ